ncbi:MAG: glycosyltransferase family 4 protein [Enterococcus sp.]|nr:glycosyltransferase family 4 protein [Enterococcus sp.]
MKVLFISSGNYGDLISPIVQNQGESLIQKGLIIHFFPIRGKGLLSYLRHVLILRNYRRKNSYDLFHAHYSLSAFVATLAGCKPLIVSLMGSDTKCGFIIKKVIQMLGIRRWNAVIVKSDSMKTDIGIEGVKIIPNGVDLKRVITKREKKTNSKEKKVLFAADPQRDVKNYQLANEAISLINNDNIVLNVAFARSYDQIIEEINNSDLVLLTSFWEGSPNIIKEAMACNCPIVTTEVGDVKWILGNTNGCYITSFDPGDVAEKIKGALNFGRQTDGRQRLIELGLDSDTVATKLIHIYEEILINAKSQE